GREELEYIRERDYIRSATNVLRRAGLQIEQGYDCTITGNIPINAGTSSSSALTVAWVAFLLATQRGSVPHSREAIAKFAHQAEVLEFKEPGGMMDHYTSAVGGLLYIDCREPITVEQLPCELSGFVLGDTRVPKETKDTLRRSRQAATEGFQMLAEMIPGFDVRTTPLDQIERYLDRLPEDAARVVFAQICNRDLCQEARRLLSRSRLDEQGQKRLGRMLLERQKHLRDGIGVSHPKLDELIEAAVEAGALGGKLNGSGMGGCMFAYAPQRQEEVKAAIEAAGGRAYVVELTAGVRVEVER
ncbi:MAG: GHMP kinase, partial [Armatimonadetes bacterium]|nr:GHMP kinase [Armatimonadota bacterium]